jgi:ABC-2 type transport system permease protein
MNISIYLKELKKSRKTLIIVTGAVVLLIIVTLIVFRSFTESGSVKEVFKMFPDEMLKAFSMNFDTFDNILGFYTAYNIFYVMIGGGIYALSLGGGLLSKEENRKTAEFLYTKPVTRQEVVWSKFLAFVTNILIFNLAVMGFAVVFMEIFKRADVDYGRFLILSLYYFLFMLMFGSLGVFITTLIRRGRNLTGLFTGIIIGFYFIDTMSKVNADIESLGYMSPFKFVDVDILVPAYGMDWWRVVYFITLALVFMVASVVIYSRKDIYI